LLALVFAEVLDDEGLHAGDAEQALAGRVDGEASTRVERGIHVDQIHLAGELGEERGQDILLVTPDEAVAPRTVALQVLRGNSCLGP